ncbi:hypothetical protein [Bacillus thuringiensis]|uniref:hypothetical protein n=1 Tax=Bacillus thuringiensis TaxID=1428 RepID=UPI000BF718AD|nr:hypothetical protein [Bacillus thuringiensis]PEV64248.1 hypothetical protein CN434_25980 [Bacillus thuringiensis]
MTKETIKKEITKTTKKAKATKPVETKPKATKPKALNITNIKKDVKHLDEMIDVTVGEYSLKVNKHFKASAISEAVFEFLSDRDKAFKAGKSIDEVLATYMLVIIIKKFTSLNVPDDIDGKIDTLKVLLDLELVGEIMDNLPQGELEKFYQTLDKTLDEMKKNLDALDNELDEMDIKNEEVRKLVTPKKAE